MQIVLVHEHGSECLIKVHLIGFDELDFEQPLIHTRRPTQEMLIGGWCEHNVYNYKDEHIEGE